MPTTMAIIMGLIIVGISLFCFWGAISTAMEADRYRRNYKKHNGFWYFLTALMGIVGVALLVCAGIILSDPGLHDRRKEQCHSLNGEYVNSECWKEQIELENS